MSPERQAWFYAGATVALWSTVATAFEMGLRTLAPSAMLLGAALVALLALGCVLLCQGRLLETLRSPARVHGLAALLGSLNPALYYLVLFEAYARLPGQVAQPLNYSWAITLALLAVPLLGQRLRAMELLAMLLAWLGVVVIATGGDPRSLQTDDPVGIALALGSTVVWALYWLYTARIEAAPAASLFLNFLYGTPLVAIFWWLDGHPVATDAVAVLSILWIGLFEMAVTFMLWLQALRLARSAAAVSSLVFVSPFISLLLLAGVVGEDIRPATPLGLLLIVGGLLWQKRLQR